MFFLNCKEQSKRNQYLGYVLFEYSSKQVQYKIVNKSPNDIFIPEDFLIRISKDSILFEAYDKSELVHYNKFMMPEMKELSSNSTIKGHIQIDNLDSLNVSRSSCYIRIFDSDFKKYLILKKMETYYVSDFSDFEKKHSFLISAIINVNEFK